MWRGHELFISSLPVLVEYIPATLFYFLVPTVISLVLSMDLPGTGGEKECAVLAGFPVCFFFGERRDWFRSISCFSGSRRSLNPLGSISTAGMPEFFYDSDLL